ncbi:uncharacterized protein LOC113520879 isoform X2 [Galleria mellonella]|uniref:Uncharacterized protein LOC113520879 isoform X2 n=1 Tax=Galleria mellonella TaxID=7137 RepID=A0ABM3M9J5_GALME|nr:uncharacterized protein LOC113520879 isoform X2 [Galleria mellonella]
MYAPATWSLTVFYYKLYNLEEMETVFRNMSEASSRKYYRHIYSSTMLHQTCFFLHMTFRAALVDFRKYYQRRYLYANNKEYEIGYLTHEIISRYQTVLEILHYAIVKFDENPSKFRNNAPPTLMFYYYTNVLEQCKVIIHLCRMMHELEKKYTSNQNPVFDDYALPENKKGKRNSSSMNQQAIDDYLKKRAAERLKRRKKYKKLRKNPMYFYATTQKYKRPTKSYWPQHYGWSIEYW